MDNPAWHKTAEVARLIDAAVAEVRDLSASSSNLNPIKQLFLKLKAASRSSATRTLNTLIEAIGDALRAIRAGDIRGSFCHSEYPTNSSTVTVNT